MNSPILNSIYETARGLHEAGVIKPETLREFDALCLPKVTEYTPTQIKKIRLKQGVSQAVFAAYLNTTVSTVQKWEQGKKKPSSMSLKLLSLVDKKGLEILI